MELEYHHIAFFQLEKAIQIYLNAKDIGDYICATTLAGAAEEILGKLLPHNLKATEIIKKEIAQLKPHIPQSFIEKHDMNRARNAYKHPVDFDKLGLQSITLKPKKEAEIMIRRGICNYISLTESIPQSFSDFVEQNEDKIQPTTVSQG